MNIQETVANQFHSAVKMLDQAIDLCPDALWLAVSGSSPNRYWHIAYHALFYTHFYLAPGESEFTPWQHHRPEYNFLGAVPWRPNEAHLADIPYTQTQLREYLDFCQSEVDKQTAFLDLEAPSGFHWLPFNKLELQFYNLRHLAHHTGQLSERLRSQANHGVSWVR
jgi:hypothetical protein